MTHNDEPTTNGSDPAHRTESDDDAPSSQPARDEAREASGEAEEPAAEPSALEVMTAERDKLREQLLRTAADFDNYRKRSKRDVEDARQRGKDDLVRELLPVFDNLERAVQTADSATEMRSVIEGVRMVLKLFEDTAERLGLARIKAVGERFDPTLHEAIQQQETDAQPPGTIMAEVVPGYRFGERLVRPALVVVARKPAASKPESGAEQSSGPTSDGAAADDGASTGRANSKETE